MGTGIFSKRSELPGELHPLALLREERLKARLPVFDWSHGNPTTANLPWPPASIPPLFAKNSWLAYEPSPLGLASAREALVRHLALEGLDVPARDAVLVASSSEAYANLFKIFCNPGDNVLVPSPSYPLFDELARWEGIELRPYRLGFAGEWHLDVESVRAVCNERTRAILVVSPNNPTGSCLTVAELHELAAFGLPIIADEVFAKAPRSVLGNADIPKARAGRGRPVSFENALCISTSPSDDLGRFPVSQHPPRSVLGNADAPKASAGRGRNTRRISTSRSDDLGRFPVSQHPPSGKRIRTLSARDVLHAHPHVVLDGLSKRLALPQVKCGWMLLGGPESFCSELRSRLEFALDAQLSLGAPVSHALGELLAHEDLARDALARRIESSEAALREAFSGTTVSVLPREAGWSAVLRVPCDDDSVLAIRLLDAYGIYVLPGALFGFSSPGVLVVSLLTAPLDVPQAARSLLACLESA